MMFSASLIVLLAGFITSMFVVGISYILPGNPLYFMINGIIPVGALVVGALAGLGFWFASTKTNLRPSKSLIGFGLATAATAWFLGYSLIYYRSGASSSLDFISFLQAYMTTSTYRMLGHDAFKLGKFGYGLAALELTGFLAPIYFYLSFLRQKPFCQNCEKFYKQIGRINKPFASLEEFKLYLEKLRSKPAYSAEFSDALLEYPENGGQRVVNLSFTLKQCPECKTEILSSDASALQKGQWKPISGFARTSAVPVGTSLMSAFGKQVT